MNIEVEYEGHGYTDPDTFEVVVPMLKITLQTLGIPNSLQTTNVREWLKLELATMCTILCSYLIQPVYRTLVALNIEYRNAVCSTMEFMCSDNSLAIDDIPVV